MRTLSKRNHKENEVRLSIAERLQSAIADHSLLTEVPEMCVPYSVRQVHGGKLTYFNFKLAKEMGLIPQNHDEKITKELEEAILNQFNVRIINEYDRIHHTHFKSEDIKPFKCFATRYLQLQHKNKQGRTSGDGRAIWNGEVSYKGKTWDLNSRGTGVTCMAPGLVEAKTPLETGNEDYGYSCGLSELPEIYASSIMSERFHKHGISTERILAAIDNGKGLGICVRAHQNLIRPAHIFRYLKLNDYYGAKKLLSYCIKRDFKNKKIDFNLNHKNAFDKYLEHFTNMFLDLCALTYHKEIFLWLDWDGDNILIDGGIIDYGSVRRFGTHHNKYKYDDVSRFSTNLDDQVKKGKLTVQVFAQLVDFVKTGSKGKFDSFSSTESVKKFDERFQLKLREYFLHDLGMSTVSIKKAIRWRGQKVEEVYELFQNLKLKKLTKEQKTVDGINQWPALNMNYFLSDIKKILQKSNNISLKKYFADFAEYSTLEVDRSGDVEEMSIFVDMLSSFQEELEQEFGYKGDFNVRLTTSAVLDLIGQVEQMPLSKYQKALTDCIEFGFIKEPKWITEVQKLYRDDL